MNRTAFLMRGIILLSAALLALYGCAPQAAPTPISLQSVALTLQWFPQTQFAGYYVALDKGWYAEEGIDLTIRSGGPDVSPVNAVRSGSSQFDTSLLADIIVANEKDNDLLSIAQIQQTNGLLLIAKKESGITKPEDFKGKRVGVWLGNWEAQFDALVAKENINTDDFMLVSQGFSMDAFLRGDLDVASAMIYNEYYAVLESGLTPDDLNVIRYEDYGLDFPGDALFTSAEFAKTNADLCARMTRATLRGWRYAVENQEEAVNITLKYDATKMQTYQHQRTMMSEIAKLTQNNLYPIGYTDRNRILRVITELNANGIIKTLPNPDDIYTNTFWEAAQ
ncbi:MAG: ABC transporter substrate-binding protein [Anaerolineales bacterium]